MRLHCISQPTIILMVLSMLGSANVMGQSTNPSLSTLPYSFTSHTGSAFPAFFAIGKFSGTGTGTLIGTDFTTDATYTSGGAANACGNYTGILNVALPRFASAGVSDNLVMNNISIYPIPVMDNVTISFNSKELFGSMIMINDLSGKQISTLAIEVAKGKNEFNFPLKNLAPGMYLLSVQTPEGKILNRIVVN